MPTLRSLRLLNAVESGTVTGTQLQAFLADLGRNSEFSVLLANRGQARRMASSSITMAAIVNSPAATNSVFQAATKETSIACQAVVSSAVAMSTVSNSVPGLAILAANPVAWGLFSKSSHYESNIKPIIANYAGVAPASYPTVSALVSDSMSMADIAAAPNAMSAVVASPSTLTLVAASSVAMALVANNSVAIDIVAKETAIMPIIAASTPAMSEIVTRSVATAKMAAYPGAMAAISGSATGWASYFAGAHFAANLPAIVANLIGLSPAAYPTLASIIADPVALAKLALHKNAISALASSGAALTALANSPNLSIMLSSGVAMGVLGPNSSAMSSFLGVADAWPTLFGSSVSKGYIVTSTALVDVVAANSALITYLSGFAKTAQPASVPDGVAGAYQAFDSAVALPAKLLTLTAREVGIAATFSNFQFIGAPHAGSQASTVLSLTGAYSIPHVAGYTNLKWDFKGAGVTAATLPIIKYFDMT